MDVKEFPSRKREELSIIKQHNTTNISKSPIKLIFSPERT